MDILINDDKQTFPDGLNIAELLDSLNMNPMLVAVELNRQLVTRSQHGQACLKDGDVIEIVTLVGGG